MVDYMQAEREKFLKEFSNPKDFQLRSFLASLGMNCNLENLGPLSSMSNTNYLFIDPESGKKVVLRMDNSDNSQVINRSNESFNSKIMEDLGISPRALFFSRYGFKVSEYLEGCSHYDRSDYHQIELLCQSLGLLHRSDADFHGNFNPTALGLKYLSELKSTSPQSEEVRSYLLKMEADLKGYSRIDKMRPCQIDLVPENLLYVADKSKVFIIDQEYSGLFYKEWDLADLSVESNMDPDQDDYLIRSYEGLTSSYVDRTLFYYFKAYCDLLWSAWALYYEETEGNMMDYFWMRYQRFLEHYYS